MLNYYRTQHTRPSDKPVSYFIEAIVSKQKFGTGVNKGEIHRGGCFFIDLIKNTRTLAAVAILIYSLTWTRSTGFGWSVGGFCGLVMVSWTHTASHDVRKRLTITHEPWGPLVMLIVE